LEVTTRVAEIRSNALEISAFRSIAVLVAGSIDASRMTFRQASSILRQYSLSDSPEIWKTAGMGSHFLPPLLAGKPVRLECRMRR
jgi:hypothetical protein